MVAQKVVSMIEAIGEVSLTLETVVTDARSAYMQLTDAQKELVTNYDVLLAAEAAVLASLGHAGLV